MAVEDALGRYDPVQPLLKHGAAYVETVPTAAAAPLRLDDVIDGRRPAPDLIVLDLGSQWKAGLKFCDGGVPIPNSTISDHRLNRNKRHIATPV
ncbi:MAG TPA: hypothetical protein VIW67_05360 [Terriglobales bacterium]